MRLPAGRTAPATGASRRGCPMLGRDEIQRRVPHAGAMCLLDMVTRCDASCIECEAAAPVGGHPLARDGGVPAVAAVEYAAQATAVHGALLDETGAPPR